MRADFLARDRIVKSEEVKGMLGPESDSSMLEEGSLLYFSIFYCVDVLQLISLGLHSVASSLHCLERE